MSKRPDRHEIVGAGDWHMYANELEDYANQLEAELAQASQHIDTCQEAEFVRDNLKLKVELSQANKRLESAVALKIVVEEFINNEVDYMTKNFLGDPEKQHAVIYGRIALHAFNESERK